MKNNKQMGQAVRAGLRTISMSTELLKKRGINVAAPAVRAEEEGIYLWKMEVKPSCFCCFPPGLQWFTKKHKQIPTESLIIPSLFRKLRLQETSVGFSSTPNTYNINPSEGTSFKG
ncbi:hypothetical protein ILYODFUR_030020 [Ilyodon furcidens]|uniref:Uncharacterized protein n=1 Tax=Ilyodon furcidens TaxID=33524 RepID=A0ABV0U9M8_9TELE